MRAAGRAALVVATPALVAVVVLAPSLADGYAALQWTRHYAAGFGSERPQERVPEAARWASRAIDALAPLPAAGEAAALALQTGRQFERERPAAAHALYVQVRAALERQQGSAWRGWGLAAVAEEARALELGARPPGAASVAGAASLGTPSPASASSAPSPSPRGPGAPSSPSPGFPPSASPRPDASPPEPARPPVKPQPSPSARRKPRPRPSGARQ